MTQDYWRARITTTLYLARAQAARMGVTIDDVLRTWLPPR